MVMKQMEELIANAQKEKTNSKERFEKSIQETREILTAPKNNKEEDKPQPSLIPLDVLMEVLEPAYRVGLKKYYRESWRKGFKATDMIDAALRHISKFANEGEDFDQEDLKEFGMEKHHIGGAIFSLICLYHSVTRYPELDNRETKERC